MPKASHASPDPSSASSRRALAALTRAPTIPVRKTRLAPIAAKRAAVVLRRGMRPLEFRRIEEALEAQSLTCVPVIVGQRRNTLADTPVCGLIVTGGDLEPSAAERDMILDSVSDMLARGAPVIALSNAIELVAEAAAVDQRPKGEAHGMLVHDGVRFLDSAPQLNAAIKKMAGAPEVTR